MSKKNKELEITPVKGSGPGGQNRNKRMSGIRIRDTKTGITVLATERRSQAQNLSHALERIETKLEKHYFRPKKRVPTRKTKASQERRIQEKKVRGQRKSNRRRDYE